MIKAIVFAALAACGINPTSSTADPPGEQPDAPPEEPIKPMDQHFCCQSVDPKNKTGDGCNTIAPTQIDACAEVLYCPGFWAKHDGKVHCE